MHAILSNDFSENYERGAPAKVVGIFFVPLRL
jgi:hypothetical protein